MSLEKLGGKSTDDILHEVSAILAEILEKDRLSNFILNRLAGEDYTVDDIER